MDEHNCDPGDSRDPNYPLQTKDKANSSQQEMNMNISEQQFNLQPIVVAGYSIRLRPRNVPPDRTADETNKEMFAEICGRMNASTAKFISSRPPVTDEYSIRLESDRAHPDLSNMETPGNFLKTSKEFYGPPNIGRSTDFCATENMNEGTQSCDHFDDQQQVKGNCSLACNGSQLIFDIPHLVPSSIEITPIEQEHLYRSEHQVSINSTHHKDGIPKRSANKPKPLKNDWVCLDCGGQFSTVQILRNHQFVEHNKKPFFCHACARSFLRRPYFNAHMKRIHGTADQNLHVCKVCSKKFARKSQLVCHELVHKEKPFSCQPCQKQMRCYDTYKAHIDKYHDEEHPYNFQICTVCNKHLVSITSLSVHMRRTHPTDRTPYTCFECRKRFALDSSLQYHVLKRHFVMKPFACRICDNVSSERRWAEKHLQNHMYEQQGHSNTPDKN